MYRLTRWRAISLSAPADAASVAGRGKGKSGGYRVVTYFCDPEAPVFLLAVLAKGSRANFSRAESNAMAKLSKAIADAAGREADARRKRSVS